MFSIPCHATMEPLLRYIKGQICYVDSAKINSVYMNALGWVVQHRHICAEKSFPFIQQQGSLFCPSNLEHKGTIVHLDV